MKPESLITNNKLFKMKSRKDKFQKISQVSFYLMKLKSYVLMYLSYTNRMLCFAVQSRCCMLTTSTFIRKKQSMNIYFTNRQNENYKYIYQYLIIS